MVSNFFLWWFSINWFSMVFPQKIRQISEMSKPRRKHWCHSTNHPQQPGTFHQATMVCELPKKSFHICRRRHGHDSGKNFRKFRRKIPFKSVPIASPLAGKKRTHVGRNHGGRKGAFAISEILLWMLSL